MPTRILPSLAIAKSIPRNADVLVVGMTETDVREVPEALARAFAKRFGGGGHAKASGAMLPGTLDQVRDLVVEAARAMLADAPPTADHPPV